MSRHQILRVFVIGAGVSASAGIPVSKNLLPALMSHDGDVAQLNSVIRYLYPSFNEKLRNYPEIEDLFNQIALAKTFSTYSVLGKDRFSIKQLENIELGLRKRLSEYLWDKMDPNVEKKDFGYITKFARLLRPSDVVISFNWDFALERSLRFLIPQPEIDYFFPGDEGQNKIHILKPHGSIDWFSIEPMWNDVNKDGWRRLDANTLTLRHFGSGIPLSRGHSALDFKLLSGDPIPIIVPPVSAKEFPHPVLKRTWTSVFRALSLATNLRIVGYSMPQEDQFARFIFRRAVRENLRIAQLRRKADMNVEVINPDGHAWDSISRTLGDSDRTIQMKFTRTRLEDYLPKR